MENMFRSGFVTQKSEIAAENLTVEGRLPSWLTGSLIRNTPAQYEINDEQKYRHWFDGLAMLHAFSFKNGSVSYRNRFLQSKAYRENNESGKINYAEFAIDPCHSIFKRLFTALWKPEFGGNANVNVTRFDDQFVALTETPAAMIFDPVTLETLGVYDYEKTDAQFTTAHPHFDRTRKVSISYAAKIGMSNEYRFYVLRKRKLDLLSSIATEKFAYTHSFGMTERFVLLAENALKLNSAVSLIVGGKPFIENFEWLPAEGSRFLVIDKGTGEVVAESPTEAFFAFHHINAFERDGEIISDIAAYSNAEIIDQLYLAKLRGDGAGITGGEFRRYRIPIGSKRATYELLSDENIELPRINYERCGGMPYGCVYGTSIQRGTRDFFNRITKFELKTGKTKTWEETNCYPGEPVFIAAPAADTEDEGVILSVVFNGRSCHSFLLCLDAQSFSEVARTKLPQTVPFGFHGQFFQTRPQM